MKALKLFLLFSITINLVYRANPQSAGQQKWQPAKYQGLIVGESSKKDVLALLGKPKWTGKEQDTGLPIMVYDVSDPVPGQLTVYTRQGVLDGMTLTPNNTLTKKQIIHIFGPDFITVRYDSDDCLGAGGSAPIYESPSGPIEHMEYRSKGIAAIFHDGEFEAITFVSKAFGPEHSLCRARTERK